MGLVFISALIGLMLVIVVSVVSSLLKFSNFMVEKSTPFECGFDQLTRPRMPFSMRFFLLTVIFLVFDVEIVLIAQSPMSVVSGLVEVYSVAIFLFVLVVGLLHEWKEGSLDWVV